MSLPNDPPPLSMLQSAWHQLHPGGSVQDSELYQTSLLTALLEGVYDGQMTFAELMKHGDFGLGTFNSLDGEMVAFDGSFYQLRSDGSARVVDPDQKTPFAAVTFFRPDQQIHVEPRTSKAELLSIIEAATEPNLFSAIRIYGHFAEVTTRTVSHQMKPYPSLVEAAASEAMRHFTDVNGTLAGFRSPAFAQGLQVAGFHLHFLRDDKAAGGHALDYITSDVHIQVATLRSLHIELPQTREFLAARTDSAAVDQQIKEAEG